MNRVYTSIRIPSDLWKRLVAEAERRDLSRNLLVTRAIEAYLNGLKPEPATKGRKE